MTAEESVEFGVGSAAIRRVGLDPMPIGVVTGGKGLADPRRAVTYADVGITSTRIAELGQASMFSGDDNLRDAGGATH
jgi:hypothetical protein